MPEPLPPDERAEDELVGEAAVAALSARFPRLTVPPGVSAYITVDEVRTNADGEVVVALRVARCSQCRRIRLRLPESQAKALWAELGKELNR